jgi:hypothetical protein
MSLACGPSLGGGDGGMEGTEGESSMGSVSVSSAASSADDTGAGGTIGSLGNGHGVVELRLLRGASEADDPFVGTARVEVTLLYLDCLADFYAANPSWRMEGADGSAVFDTALGTGLCDPSAPELVDCTVAGFVQLLDEPESLTVSYDVTRSLEGFRLRFGPVPSAQLAACADGGLPIVRLGATESVRGFDAAGTVIWRTEAFSPDESATDQGSPLEILVSRG